MRERKIEVNETLAVIWTVGSVVMVALLIAHLTGCATGDGSSVHVFGGRSQTGTDNAMEAPSDVQLHDLLRVPIDEIQVGPGEIPGISRPDLDSGEGGISPGDPAPVPDKPPSGPPSPVLGDMPPPPPRQPGDGGGLDERFLWKPNSEGHAGADARVLLPQSLTATRVTVNGEDLKKNPNPARNDARWNGNRQHWHVPHPGQHYGSGAEVVAYYGDTEIGSWNVPNGGQRYTQKLDPLPTFKEPEPEPEPDVPPVPGDDLTSLERESKLWVRNNMLHIHQDLDIRYKVDRNPTRSPTGRPNTTVRAQGVPLTKVPYDSREMFYQIIDRKEPHSMTLWAYFRRGENL